MSLTNCIYCGAVLVESYTSCCKGCVPLHLERARMVKQYMLSNPRASMIDVYHGTGVPLKTIKEIVRVV
ncbi:hypothetical protein [Paenibacillus turpanensis]|uniref:hypothetical protein n=1 Tax=Paenibacillus turpanensis TaxID=2689078 RepID=UPI001409D2D3|nr:hypothetical protein [Paenibacillus turpanensis]